MTRKDYVLMAKNVRQYRDHIVKMMNNGLNDQLEGQNKLRLQGAEMTIILLANALEQDNPNFNRSRFLEACGLK